MYHGILVDKSFINPKYPEKYKVFSQKIDGNFKIFGIEIGDFDLDNTVLDVQQNMRPGEPWYAHFYNDEVLVVIFKNKLFAVNPHRSTWRLPTEYGKSLNIPEKQLDFWPNRFQDEVHFFV